MPDVYQYKKMPVTV